jgi:hypothetical protein
VKSRLLATEDAAWMAILDRARHDFFHLPGYAALQAAWEGGEAHALHVADERGEMLLPVIVRPIPGGGRDATSPYGYPGPIVAGSDEPAFLHDALKAGLGHLAGEGLVSLFLRPHPLLNRHLPDDIGVTVRHGETVVVDLSLPPEELWRQTRRDHRNQINRARREGLGVTWDHGCTRLAEFQRLYGHTMARLGAAGSYFYDLAWFEGLRGALGARLHLALVEIEGELAAASLFGETDGIVQYFLSAQDERFRRAAPMKLLIDEARTWARARGDRWLYLGGGLGAADTSLMHFKEGFSESRVPLHTMRIVLRAPEYRALALRRRPPGDLEDLRGYFPAYRDPA